MVSNPRAFDPALREARQRAYLSVPTIARQYPGIEELGVELRFMKASGQPYSSPYKRIFVPDMQAFFEFRCPDPDCTGGGFDLGSAIREALHVRNPVATGTLRCRGATRRDPCGVLLHYNITAQRCLAKA